MWQRFWVSAYRKIKVKMRLREMRWDKSRNHIRQCYYSRPTGYIPSNELNECRLWCRSWHLNSWKHWYFETTSATSETPSLNGRSSWRPWKRRYRPPRLNPNKLYPQLIAAKTLYTNTSKETKLSSIQIKIRKRSIQPCFDTCGGTPGSFLNDDLALIGCGGPELERVRESAT